MKGEKLNQMLSDGDIRCTAHQVKADHMTRERRVKKKHQEEKVREE